MQCGASSIFGRRLASFILPLGIPIHASRTKHLSLQKKMAVINIKDDAFSAELDANEKVVIKYFANWCGSCKLMAPKFRRLSEDDRFEGIRFLEVNAEENELARKTAGVNNLPFIATFYKGELKEGVATSKEDMIVQMLENLKQ
jgi:thiol-disulfide isomerase/thioredoxin